jgi:serine phosphatase RsbU (regulator of sigma subunit)/anti-sigma regulatory factor (Ser/Thr protein kinase)
VCARTLARNPGAVRDDQIVVISLADRERPRDRPPKPELQLNLLGTLAATSLALLAYLVALLAHLSLPTGFAVVLLAVAPACAIPSTVLMAIRARAEQDEALRAVTAGLVVADVGMVLQLFAFRALSPGGGVFATSSTGSALLNLAWHVALPAGALAATLGRPRSARRRIGLAFGVALMIYFAAAAPGNWVIVHADGSYSVSYVLAIVAVIAFTIGVVVRWVLRNGLRPTATRGWITVAMVLSVYDLILNVLGHHRYSSIWWASLGIRAATFAVLLSGLLVNTASQLQRLERYATYELDRAEGEVNSWAEVTERLLAATSALSAAVTADDVAVLLTAAGAGAIEVDDALIYLLERDGPQRFRVIGGLREGLGPTVDDVPGYPYTDVLRTRTPIFLENAAQIAKAYPAGTGQHPGRPLQCLAALPLIAGDTPVGALLLTGTRPREFRRLDQELLGALARVGAQSLSRALLYEQQSSLSTTLQSALLPQSLPMRPDVDLVGRYLPATVGVDVGGDWYDVLELGGSKLLLVVGDVMGKGVPAATLMGQMRSAVRTLAAVDPDPAAILSGLDQLARGFAPDDIVTLVIVSLDVETGVAVVANAGHLSPLVFAPGMPGELATPETRTSPPIGVPVTGPRASAQLRLAPGSGLLLLTDGLVEERDNDLDAAVTTLTQRASYLLDDPEADLDTVADALVQPRVHRDDDVTVLLARLRSGRHATVTPSVRSLLSVQLDNDPGGVSTARRLVRDAVLSDGEEPTSDLLDSILLVTSELVTNGLRHGEPPVTLTLDRKGHRLRLTVTDAGSKIPRPRMAGPESTGGRGLFLVSVLSTAWKIEPHGNEWHGAGQGTSVWAEFAL